MSSEFTSKLYSHLLWTNLRNLFSVVKNEIYCTKGQILWKSPNKNQYTWNMQCHNDPVSVFPVNNINSNNVLTLISGAKIVSLSDVYFGSFCLQSSHAIVILYSCWWFQSRPLKTRSNFQMSVQEILASKPYCKLGCFEDCSHLKVSCAYVKNDIDTYLLWLTPPISYKLQLSALMLFHWKPQNCSMLFSLKKLNLTNSRSRCFTSHFIPLMSWSVLETFCLHNEILLYTDCMIFHGSFSKMCAGFREQFPKVSVKNVHRLHVVLKILDFCLWTLT